MSSPLVSAVADKRRGRPRDESATEFLRDFPALLALGRLPVPILAVDDRGDIAFANDAFAAMVGYSREELEEMTAQSLVACIAPTDSGVVAVLREHANSVIRLLHADGWTMPTLISDSVLIREDEQLAVVVFTDLTEIAWDTSPDDDLLPGEPELAADF
ncbi:PAS domain-containing protein [Mycobacterium sp.]|uniref:PAS domain-containing protein n=1 Tax=Mycobacterium sp. TaxID=1785 RepID=UPI003BB1A5C5